MRETNSGSAGSGGRTNATARDTTGEVRVPGALDVRE